MNTDLWILAIAALVMLAIGYIVPAIDWILRRRRTVLDEPSALENEAAARINNNPNHPAGASRCTPFNATHGWTVELAEPINAAPFMRATKDDQSYALAIPPLYTELDRALAIGNAKRAGLLSFPDDAADAFCEFLIHLAARLQVTS